MPGLMNKGKAAAWSSGLLTPTIDAILMAAAYTPNVDDDFVSAIATNEIPTVTGYTRGFGGGGRVALASKAIAEDDTGNLAKFTASNLSYTLGAGATIAFVVLAFRGASDAASELFSYHEVTPNVTTNGSGVNLNWNASGIATY